MTRLEKCEMVFQLGYRYNPETGLVHNRFGNELGYIMNTGYIALSGGKKFGLLLLHHFAWFSIYGNVDFKEIDHINRIKTDNRISNLRIATRQQNMFNKGSKGYYWNKRIKKYICQIMINKKKIYGGIFNTEEEAIQKYLELKKMYHQL